MESYCEIWEGFFGVGSWCKKFLKLENEILEIYDDSTNQLNY